MKLLRWALLLLILLPACARGPAPQRLAKATLGVGGRAVTVEAACTDAQRQTGLMHRRRLGPDEGMLFVFRREQELAFYMRNTHVPLSIAFLRADGTITNIADMAPLTLQSHYSRLPCQYALEMPQGWFDRHRVREGDRIDLPADLRGE